LIQKITNTKLQNAKHSRMTRNRQMETYTDRQTCSHKIALAANKYEKNKTVRHDHNVEYYITKYQILYQMIVRIALIYC